MDRIINILKQNWTYLAGAVIGGVAGYLYWFYIGCSGGTCPITASPAMSIIWGAAMGSLLLSFFKKKGNEE